MCRHLIPKRYKEGQGTTHEKPLAYRVVRGGIWVAFSQYWTIGFGFVATIILTRLLTPEMFGQFAYAQFFAGLVALSPKIGLRYAYVYHKETNAESIGTYISLELLAAIISFALILLVSPILPESVAMLVIVLVLSQVFAVGGLGAVLLEKELRLGLTSGLFSLIFPASYIPSFVLAFAGYGVWSLVAQVVTNYMLSSIAYLWVFRRQLHRISYVLKQVNWTLGGQFMRTGSFAGLSDFGFGLTRSLDSFFIGWFVNEATLGYYDRARRISFWPATLLTNMVNRTSLYTYAQLQNDQTRLHKTVGIVSWFVTLLSIPISILVFFTAPELVSILYGAQWLPSIPYLQILAISLIGWPLIENLNTLMISTGQTQIVLRLTLLQVAMIVVFGASMTLLWGAIGTCVAMVLATTIRALIMIYVTNRKLSGILQPIFKGLLPAGIGTMLVYLTFNYFIGFNINSVVIIQFLSKSGFIVGTYLFFVGLIQPQFVYTRLSYIWALVRQNETNYKL